MNLRLQIRPELDDCSDDERAYALQVIREESRKFGARLADRFEEEGLEVTFEGHDETPGAPSWRERLRRVGSR